MYYSLITEDNVSHINGENMYLIYHDVLLSLYKQTSDLSIGYILINTSADACD